MISFDTAAKLLEVFARLTDEKKLVAIEIGRCLAEGKTSDNPQIAAFMARHDATKIREAGDVQG